MLISPAPAPFFGAHTPDYAAAEAAHRTLSEKTGAGSDFLGWTELPRRIRETELARILAAGKAIREKGNALVVVGIGGSYLGARAAYELIGRREGRRGAALCRKRAFRSHAPRHDRKARRPRFLRERRFQIRHDA